MPELPEVETIVRGLRPQLVGHRLVRVIARRPDLRIPLPPQFAGRLRGRRVESLRRRAKYILAGLDDGAVLIAHLGMAGQWLARRCEDAGQPGAHDHVEFETDDGMLLTYRDPRRFGLMTLTSENELGVHPLLASLGLEPLGNEFNGPALSATLAGRRTPVKAALLDQRVVAGIGNIYACEALYRAGISPRRMAASVPGVRAERLAAAIRSVLAEAIEAGGSSLRDYIQSSGELGYFQHFFQVYGREGEPCPGCDCGAAIRRIVQSGRSTFFCGHRQR
jgi:formamidopyrimidine-DNA glycosylase